MKLFDTQSQLLKTFTVHDNHVGIYVCGVTPYDTTHLGHAFTFLTYDVLVRYLRYKGFDVTYVQNVTDIDDDILRKSKEMGMSWRELADSETQKYLADMTSMNAVPFDHYVAATAHVEQILHDVEALVDGGHAYVVDGSVYYAVKGDADFGKLSHLPIEAMLPIANERGNVPDDPKKHDPLDFVLWQAAQPGEPTWTSPWGEGRPGWHIECSAMSRAYLGDQIDIHGGGYDLVFPHHECEIAQAEHVTGVTPFVRYWMHVAMVEYQGEKMSKSLGNLVRVGDLLQTYSADAIRLCLTDHHYRRAWEFFDDDMKPCADAASMLLAAATKEDGSGDALDAAPYVKRFEVAMDDDFDTPKAQAILLELGTAIRHHDGSVADAQSSLRTLGSLLGLVFA